MGDRYINSYPPEERRQIMVNRLHQIVRTRNGEFDEEAYVNKRTPIIFRCSKGHEWSAQPQTVLGGSLCRQCWNGNGAGKHLRLSDGLQQARNIATKRSGECLSTTYDTGISPMYWKCKKGPLRGQPLTCDNQNY